MTNSHQILAHVGAGSDHHIPELEVITAFSGSVTDGPNDHRACQRRSWLFGP